MPNIKASGSPFKYVHRKSSQTSLEFLEDMILILVLIALFCVVLRPGYAIDLNVSRSLLDTFTSNCSLCAQFNKATCIEKGVCRCPKVASTFFIHKERCGSPSNLVNELGCLGWFPNKTLLKVVNLTSSLSTSFVTTFSQCGVPQATTLEYLGRQGNWMKHKLQGGQPVFSIENPRRMALKVFGNKDLMSLAGRIIRVDLLCKGREGQRKSCLIMKAAGTISTMRDVSPSPADVTTRQHGNISTTTSRTVTKTTTTHTFHYIGTQSKPHYTLTTSNSTAITQERINGAASINKTDKKGDKVVVAIISVLGAMACVLIISAVFAWFIIKYYKRFRRQDERNTPSSLVIGNQDIQNAILMSTRTIAGQLSEPVYSELPDVVESANRIRSGTCASTSIPINKEDAFFVIRNPLQYNTLPRARKLTDPLPVPPLHLHKPLDLQIIQITTADPKATKTSHFLYEARKQLQDVPRISRKRSCTDVGSDTVFFENIAAKDVVEEQVGNCDDEPNKKSPHSFYEDLSATNKGSRISIYEPLERATLQPQNVRKTTLDKIKDQVDTEDHPTCSGEDSAPEYHILEPSPVNETRHDNQDSHNDSGTLSSGADIKGPYSPPLTGYHVEQGPSKDRDQCCTNQGHDFDVGTSEANERKQASQSGETFKDNRNIRTSESQDSSLLNNGHRRTSERRFLRRRAKSLDI